MTPYATRNSSMTIVNARANTYMSEISSSHVTLRTMSSVTGVEKSYPFPSNVHPPNS